ncbi:MAG: acyl carrier protein [Pseudomonadota bacterium]
MTADPEEEVFWEVRGMLQAYNKSNKPIESGTDILEDLEVDSLSVMNFIMKLEDHFDISIPLNVLSDIRTVGDLAATITQLKKDA